MKDPSASARETVAATLVRIEKEILHRAIEELRSRGNIQGITCHIIPVSHSMHAADDAQLPSLPANAPLALV